MIAAALVRGLIVRQLARRRLRCALVVGAVAIGVAAFVASEAVVAAVLRGAGEAVSAAAGGAELSVQSLASSLPADAAARVREVPGVAAAAPRVAGWVRVAGESRRVLVLGVDPLAESAFLRAEGRRADDVAAVADPLLLASGVGALVCGALPGTPDAPLELVAPDGAVTLARAGRIDDARLARAGNGAALVVALPTAQRLLGRGARVDRVDLRLARGADAGDVATAVRARLAAPPALPDDVTVAPPGTADGTAADVLGIIRIAMRVGAGIALLVGLFLIHHTVAVGVAERTREVAILRAMGATRGQVRAVFVGEALLLAAVGAALGALLARLLAGGALHGFVSTMTLAYYATEGATVRIDAGTTLVAALLGVGVACVAAWAPASRAAALPPGDGLRRGSDADEPAVRGVPWRALLAGGAAVTCVTFVVLPDLVGKRTGYVALTALLVAFVAASPWIVAVASAWVARPLERLFGVPGRLAADELRSHPRRAALPAAALAVGVALVLETRGSLDAMSDETVRWMEQNIAGALFVSSGTTIMRGGGHTPLPARLAEDIAAVPGVAHVVTVRFRRVPWNGTRLFLLGLDLEAYLPVWRMPLREGGLPAHLPELTAGRACLASANFVRLHGLDVGDTVTLPSATGPLTLTIADVFTDYSWPRGTLIVHQPTLAAAYADELADEFSVTLAPGADADTVRAAIERTLGADREVVIVSAAVLRDETRQVLADVFSLADAQVGLALSVAFLGVLNALTISVVLRRRDIGLLRAVGATRGQVVLSIVLSGAALGAVGSALGLGGGWLVEWVLLQRIVPADTGWVYPPAYPWTTAALLALLGTATSAVAAALPARWAAGAPLAESLAYE